MEVRNDITSSKQQGYFMKLGSGWISWIIFWGALAVYGATVVPGVVPADNGEFQLVAAQLGVAHPPGFPLYSLLGHLATYLPIGESVAYRINFLSAGISAGSLTLLYLAMEKLTQRKSAGIIAVLALGTATTFWAQAVIANIRSLTLFFAALAVYALIQLYQSSSPSRFLYLLVAALSLGVTHHASLIFMALVFGVGAVWRVPALFHQPKTWLYLFLAGGLGLLPLLYLPWRDPNLAQWQPFWDHVLARGFAGDLFYFEEGLVLWERLQVMGNVLTFQFHPVLLVGMGLGFGLLFWRQRSLATILGMAFLCHSFITATYRAPQTVEYMMPAYLLLAFFLGYALTLSPKPTISIPFGLVFYSLLLWQGANRYQTFRHYPLAEDTQQYTDDILKNAPANALVLANWHWATPLWYRQQVEGQRSDLTILYLPPAGEAYGQTWANRIGAELGNGREVIATWWDANAYAALPPAEPLGEAFWFRQQARQEMPALYTPFNETISSVHLLGYHLTPNTVEMGQETVLNLAWQPTTPSTTTVGLYAHLLSADGQLVGQADLSVLPQVVGITLTQLRITPHLGITPGDYQIVIGVANLPNSSTYLTSLLVENMSQPPFTTHPLYFAQVAPDQRLIGYDWDSTLPAQTRLYLHWQTPKGYHSQILDNPNLSSLDLCRHWLIRYTLCASRPNGQHYVPLGQGIVWLGGTVDQLPNLVPEQKVVLEQQFASRQTILRDWVVSVRLAGLEPDGFSWAWTDLSDQVPALGAIPTLKWVNGCRISDPHLLTISSNIQPNQAITGMLRLYDAFSQHPLPILDSRIIAQTIWVPLGTTVAPP